MVNHLARGDEGIRNQQASELVAFAETLDAPLIAVGDYNFDWDIPTGEGNEAFEIFTSGEVYEWVQPTRLVKTQCSPDYNSVLDFVFTAKGAEKWARGSAILDPNPFYCEMNLRGGSDHRPVIGFFEVQ